MYRPPYSETRVYSLRYVINILCLNRMVYKTLKTRRKRRAKRRTKIRRRGGGPGPTISFISYGNDKYKSSKERIKKEAEEMGIFNGNIRIYSPDDLNQEFKAAVGPTLQEYRGGGYWLWKPYIINDMLNQLKEDDILLYADAGCALQPVGLPRLKEYIDMISKASGKCILAMRLEYPENNWTSSAIFEHFGIQPEDERATSNQILATVSMYRKCKESMALVSAWLKVAMEYPELFTNKDHNESKKKRPEFSENRHDQSIFSVLLKSPPHSDNTVIIDEEIEARDKNVSKFPIFAGRSRN